MGVSSSACGVCGTGSIERLAVRAALPTWTGGPLSAAFLAGLPGRLQALQPGFAASGGLHAAGLFRSDGACLCVYEDVGRHNATDKVIGWALEHAAVMTTSLHLHLTPELVDMSLAPTHGPIDYPPYYIFPQDPARGTESGCLSSPAPATAEKGKLVYDTVVGSLRELMAREFAH